MAAAGLFEGDLAICKSCQHLHRDLILVGELPVLATHCLDKQVVRRADAGVDRPAWRNHNLPVPH